MVSFWLYYLCHRMNMFFKVRADEFLWDHVLFVVSFCCTIWKCRGVFENMKEIYTHLLRNQNVIIKFEDDKNYGELISKGNALSIIIVYSTKWTKRKVYSFQEFNLLAALRVPDQHSCNKYTVKLKKVKENCQIVDKDILL